MTMLDEQHNDSDIVETVWPKPKWSVSELEAALKQRIGWVDEVISPFARGGRQTGQPPQAKSIEP